MVVVWAVDAFWVAGVACGEDGMRDVAVGDVEGALLFCSVLAQWIHQSARLQVIFLSHISLKSYNLKVM